MKPPKTVKLKRDRTVDKSICSSYMKESILTINHVHKLLDLGHIGDFEYQYALHLRGALLARVGDSPSGKEDTSLVLCASLLFTSLSLSVRSISEIGFGVFVNGSVGDDDSNRVTLIGLPDWNTTSSKQQALIHHCVICMCRFGLKGGHQVA